MGKYRHLTKYIRNFLLVILFSLSQVIASVGPFIQPAKAYANPTADNETSKLQEYGNPSDTTNNDPEFCTSNDDKVKNNVPHGDCEADGALQVHKKVDADGNGSFEGGDTTANTLGFKWGLDNETPARSMGSTAEDISTGSHTISENSITDYVFVGWYAGYDHSCTYPNDTHLPTVTILKDETKHITLCNAYVKPHNGTIQIVKQADDSGDKHFGFETDWMNLPGSDFGLLNGETKKFSDLEVNTSYTVTENAHIGWYLDSIVCTGGASVSTDVANRKVVINLGSGEDVTCTFHNKKESKLKIVKDVSPGYDNQNFDFSTTGQGLQSFTLDDDGNNANDHKNYISFEHLKSGAFTITENNPEDWSLYELSCVGTDNYSRKDSTLQLTLTPGSDVTCTFVNKEAPKVGRLKVVKDLYPNTDSGKFNLQINGQPYATNVGDGGTTGYVELPIGSYVVSETAGVGTALNDYHTSYKCVVGEYTVAFGYGTSLQNVPVLHHKDTVCTFYNKRLPKVTVVKEAHPADGTDFCFTLRKWYRFPSLLPGDNDPLQSVETAYVHPSCDFQLDDGNDADAVHNWHSEDLQPGTYIITEKDIPYGWSLTDIRCYGTDEYRVHNTVIIKLVYGDKVTCKFVNKKDATVVVTKFNDFDRDGHQDAGEPALADWDINLKAHNDCEIDSLSKDYHHHCDDASYDQTLTTNTNGHVYFTGVKPYKAYSLSELENHPGWHWSNTYCSYEDKQSEGYPTSYNNYTVVPEAGEYLHCYIGNYQDAHLLIEKTNNRPEATTVGDTVTYTLTVRVPETSGAIFNAVVRDVPPAGFSYVAGSWTSTSPTTTDPLFNPVGVWQLGTLLPGDVVTLTYQATIDASVSPGTYTNIAFAEGCARPQIIVSEVPRGAGGCCDEDRVTTDFVESDVTVQAPQVLGTTTTRHLVNTGTPAMWRELAFSLTLVAAALVTALLRQKKGSNS